MRGSILIKFLKTIELLSKPEGTTIKELEEELDVDRKSVYREIAIVEKLGFPLYQDEIPFEKRKRWRLDEGYLKKLPNMKIPDINLSLPEIIALYLLRSEGRMYKGTEIETALNTAFGKMEMFVPNGLYDNLKKIKTLFASSSKFAKDYSGKEEIIETLADAMLKNSVCRVKYHSFYDDRTKEFEMWPLNFFENDGGLYLYIGKEGSGQRRTLAVERIQELKVMSSTFEYPKDFDPEETLEAAFDIVYDDPIEAKIWFSAGQARYIKERKWAKDQKITDQPDGSIILEMKTSGWNDVKRWVLSFGAEAEVLEPAKLRRDVVNELKSAGRKYRGVLKGRE
ncbi:MAG: transcriptional regulator [Deltaproteobacteria bacterium]|nr:transcriptional regulator [Deltaproteobacteria bacterium]